MIDNVAPFSALTVGDWLRVAALATVRLLPVVSFTPLFGGAITPTRIRTAYGAMFGLVFVPVIASAGAPPASWSAIVPLAVKEFLIGGFVALVIRMLFDAYAAAGGVIDFIRGASNASIMDPFKHGESSVMEGYLRNAAVAMFVVAGGHAVLFEAWSEGYRHLPAQSMPDPGPLADRAIQTTILLAGMLMTLAVKLAAPVLVTIMLIELGVGLATRAAGSLHPNFLAFPLKMVVVFALTAAIATVHFLDPAGRFLGLVVSFLRAGAS